ncbi:MAG: aldo/keto reductase [Oscillospiraceae bacterium]|jgi:predicted aldo/keto reductase-like oxidoreductase|nr:aldo/keto reductase [Oscillospiraceae bacterium]
MQYRKDLKSGEELSILGYGCMRFPRGISGKIDYEKSEKLVLEAIEQGINYYDTAYIYGGSEEILGEILHRNNMREKVLIATKLPYQKCKSKDDFERLFSIQQQRLHTNYIDYYLIHNISALGLWEKLCEMGILEWIAEKKAAGKIRHIGFSFHGAQGEFFKLLNAYEWDFCQIQYNYINENYQAGRAGLEAAAAKGLPVIIMEPLLGGKLASGLPKKAERLLKEANGSITPAAWALRWLWNQPNVTVVLSGMGSEEQLRDNLKTAESALPDMLTPKEEAAVEVVKTVFNEAFKVPCTGCNYCMPCPYNVNIPACFAAYNASFVTGFVSGMTLYMTSTGVNHPDKNYSARRCTQCGKCEKHCPQHIEIRKQLQSVSRKMEPIWLRPVILGLAKVFSKPK